MSRHGDESAHDEKLAQLLGDDAEVVFAAPVAYPPLQLDLIASAIEAGKVCRTKTPGARLLVFRGSVGFRAVVTELRHGGYRRAYATYAADTLPMLVRELAAKYSAT